MPSDAPDADTPEFAPDAFRQEVEQKMRDLPLELMVAIAARAAWRVAPLMFVNWSSPDHLADWWKGYGESISAALVACVLKGTPRMKVSGSFYAAARTAYHASASASASDVVTSTSTSTSASASSFSATFASSSSSSSYPAPAAALAADYAADAAQLHSPAESQLIVEEIRADLEKAGNGTSSLADAPLWRRSSLTNAGAAWWDGALREMQAYKGTAHLHAWLQAMARGAPPVEEMKQWFDQWWLNHPENTGKTSAFEEAVPPPPPAEESAPPEPVIRKRYIPPEYRTAFAGDGAPSQLTDTAEKCKEALRAFVASGETEAPVTVSVEAPWGAGKTSFLHHLRRALEGKDRIPTVWFNPWKHEAGKTLWAAFAVAYERQMAEKLSPLGVARRRLVLSWQRLSAGERLLLLLRLAMWLLAVAALVWLWWHGADWMKEDTGSKAKALLATKLPMLGIPLLFWGFIKDLVGSFSTPLKLDVVSVFTRNQHEDAVDDLHRFHADFERLMCAYTPGSGPLERFLADLRSHTDPHWPDQWRALARAVVLGVCRGVRRLFYTYALPAPEKLRESPRPRWSQERVVVFIDDLDRCEAPKAAEVLQSLHLMLTNGVHERRPGIPTPPGVVCILGMDREKVAAAVAAKHEKLLPILLPPEGKDGKVAAHQALGFGHKFLEKFIQITLHLPGLVGQDQEQYLRHITGWKGEDSPPAAAPAAGGASPNPAVRAASWAGEDRSSPPPPPPGREAAAAPQAQAADDQQAVEAVRAQQAVRDVETRLSDGHAAFLCASYVAAALEHNPRRLKQFVNLFRLRLFLSAALGLLDTDTLDVLENHQRQQPEKLSVHDIAKLVALDLCCPQTMNTLREAAAPSFVELTKRISAEHSEPRKSAILAMVNSETGEDAEPPSAYDLREAPLSTYFQQLASMAPAPALPLRTAT